MGYTIDDFKKDFEAIKKKFSGEEKFIDLKLQDGTIVRINGEKPMVNAMISAIDEAGQLIPLPTGNYVAEDGSMINVTDGVITAYEPKGQEAAPANPAETTQKPDEQMANDNTQGQPPVANPKAVIESIVKETRFEIEKDYNEKFTKVNEAIEAFKKENETLKAENTSLSEKLTKQETFTKEMFSLVEKMAAQPAEVPVAPKKDGVQSKEIVGGLSIWKH